MKDWIKRKLREHSAYNVILFPLREEDVKRRLRNIEIDKIERASKTLDEMIQNTLEENKNNDSKEK